MLADRVIFGCIIVFAGVYVYATAQIPSLDVGDPLGARAFPVLLGLGLFLTAGLLLVEMQRAGKTARSPAKGEPEDRRHMLIIAAVTAWTGLYYAVFEQLGYVLATTIFLLALMIYFNRGKWIANVVTAILFSVASYLLFVKVLGVNLPGGILIL